MTLSILQVSKLRLGESDRVSTQVSPEGSGVEAVRKALLCLTCQVAPISSRDELLSPASPEARF